MAKIRITESELRQLVSESVISVLNEELGEDMASRFNRRYNAYRDAEKNYNDNFSKEWNDLPPEEKQKWQGELDKMRSDPNSAKYLTNVTPESIYNSRRNSAKSTMDSTLNRRGVGTKMKGELDIANKNLAALYGQLKANDQNGAMGTIQSLQKQSAELTNQNTAYKNAITQILNTLNRRVNEAAAYDSSWDGAPGSKPKQETVQQFKVPELQGILAAIGKLQGQIKQLTKANQTLTSSNNTLKTQMAQAQQRQQNTQNMAALQGAPKAQPAAMQKPTTQGQLNNALKPNNAPA